MNNPSRPIGSFVFLGPTGTGKTRMVESIAESLIGDARAMIKIDCAEFQHSHEIAKLVGSPPGYLGHRETHPALSQEALSKHHTEQTKLSFVLFDEIEKASDALWNLLLGILDKATLTLGDNRKVDFSSTMIFLTSNLGASEMSALARPKLGFAALGGIVGDRLQERSTNAALEAARRKFTPEFINRLDKVVVFKRLGYLEIIKYLQDVIFSSDIRAPEVKYFQTQRLRVTSEQDVPVELDGELAGNCPVEFRIQKKALLVLAPPPVQ